MLQVDSIDEAWVRRNAAMLGLEISDEQLPGVVLNLRRMVQIASALDQLPLGQSSDELGPVWRP